MTTIRRHDLDWLRVIVFGLLIFYHVGMFFVPWDWHIQNNQIYGWLRFPMVFLNQWRLPILFVISGMGTAYALSFRSARQFIKERFMRLYIPLAAGMILIVPPQVYIERVVNGEVSVSFLDWMLSGSFLVGIYPEGNFSWHHLWFLPYLLVFSLLLTPAFIRLRGQQNGRLFSWLTRNLRKNPWFLYAFILPLFLYELFLEPFFEVTHNLVWDWYNFISSLTLFFYGFVLISIREIFWQALDQIWRVSWVIGIGCFAALMYIWLFVEDSLLVHVLEAFLKVTNLWAWILTLFGLAASYLNKPSRSLRYANRAVYPFYILHQTITVILAFFIYQQPWGLLLKAAILIVGTFGISWMIYEGLIRRIKWLRPLFGVK